MTETTAGATATTAATAGASGQWAAQMIALNPVPVDTYGTDPTVLAYRNEWIPVGLTGTDFNFPPPVWDEAYSDGNGNLISSHIVAAIGCDTKTSADGTNLATPIVMATYYLQHFGRPNVIKGILLETDGQPFDGNTGDPGNYTCAAADAAATAAKTAANPIQIFTVGFGLDDGTTSGQPDNPACPDSSWHSSTGGNKARDLLASMATQPSVNGGCPGTSNTDGDHFFCEPKTADLTAVFTRVASQLLGQGSRLVQLYPAPVVTSAGGAVSSVTISGEYFTGATSVTFGGASASSFTVGSDNSIVARAPAGASGSKVDVIVSSPGGSSAITPADVYTYP
jgi:hypothetical protein